MSKHLIIAHAIKEQWNYQHAPASGTNKIRNTSSATNPSMRDSSSIDW